MAFALRPWVDADAAWYIGVRDEVILRWTTEPAELTTEEFTESLAGLDGVERAGFAVTTPYSSEPVGNVAAVRKASVAEISYWVAPGSRGIGAASAALGEMTGWVVDNWDVDVIELLIHPENEASIRVAERAGYERGELRSVAMDCAGPEGLVVVYSRATGAT